MASFDLPEHLQGLNTLAPSPPVARDDDQEFWAYLHADDLFKNFGTNEAYQPKPEAATVPPPTPVDKRDAAPSLSDFIAKFVSDPNAGMPAEPTAGLPYPFNVNYSPAVASSSAPTPRTPLSAGLAGINTADIIPRPEPIEEDDDESEERITGAKRLKQLGADTATIQEDKRRRNTEASARFRAKKKEREQAVEQQNKILQAQVAELTAQKQRLESENTLLRQIVLHGKPGAEGSAAPSGDLASLFAGLKRKREE